MTNYAYIALIPLLPLTSFILLGIFGSREHKAFYGWTGTICITGSALLSIYTCYRYFFVDETMDGAYHPVIAMKQTWLEFSQGISIDMGILIDPASVMMITVVSFISLMVHIYSIIYMKPEKRYSTYFSFLSLFTFSMLGLVLSTNLFQVYIFWELVGISSFLLIGFYYDKPSAVAASKKAFIVTRFADLGFLIGILIFGWNSGTLDISLMIDRLTDPSSPQFLALSTTGFLGLSLLTWALMLVFIGGAGKSAMLPFHIWLPDAMEGPTPVSALIHAATMVVAGVYLVARLFPVYTMDPVSLQVITWVGVLSALLAAIIACTQQDIKRILAFSTMSQIGFMMLALGVTAYGNENNAGYTASLFHLFTHAFFKSLLFLCAGVVIHLVHSNSIEDMGGLRKALPFTHACFLIACLAIAGIPPFAGFFSKESILVTAYNSNKFVFSLTLFTAMLTSFYMFRLYFSVFWKRPVLSSAHHSTATEMKIPLLLLAFFSIAAGWIPFNRFVTASGVAGEWHFDLLFSVAPVAMALAGIIIAAWLYKKENNIAHRAAHSLGTLYKAASRKFYFDEAWMFITKKIIFPFAGRPAAWIDKNIVDGLMNGIASQTGRLSFRIKGLQSGKVQGYALYFFIGIFLMSLLFIYMWK